MKPSTLEQIRYTLTLQMEPEYKASALKTLMDEPSFNRLDRDWFTGLIFLLGDPGIPSTEKAREVIALLGSAPVDSN